MPPTPGRSSKEWKASALEKARKAEAQAAAKRQYQQQLEELQARLKQAEKLEKENNEQAEIERQAARDQEFQEIKLVKQAEFRNTVADEVFTRIAHSLNTKDDHEYIKSVAERQPGFEDPTEIKAMLWEAIAGTDTTYLCEAACKIADRLGKPISEDDLGDIEDSVACLDSLELSTRQPPMGTEEAMIEVSAAVEGVPSTPTKAIPGDDAVVPSTEHVKQEAKVSAKRNAMDDIELASRALAQESQSTASNDIELTDALGNIITGEEVPNTQVDQILQTPKAPNTVSSALSGAVNRPFHTGTPQGSTTSTRKRAMTEEGTPTPSEAGSITTTNASASKKRKPNGIPAKPTASTKFIEHIESRAPGTVTNQDLLCSKCDSDAENPRVSANCHHVYCNTCFNELKAEQGTTKGKKSNATLCCHVGCDSKVGTMGQVSVDVIRRLKEALVRRDERKDEGQDDRDTTGWDSVGNGGDIASKHDDDEEMVE